MQTIGPVNYGPPYYTKLACKGTTYKTTCSTAVERQYRTRNKKVSNNKCRLRMTGGGGGETVRGSRYTDFSLERTHFQMSNLAWTSFPVSYQYCSRSSVL